MHKFMWWCFHCPRNLFFFSFSYFQYELKRHEPSSRPTFSSFFCSGMRTSSRATPSSSLPVCGLRASTCVARVTGVGLPIVCVLPIVIVTAYSPGLSVAMVGSVFLQSHMVSSAPTHAQWHAHRCMRSGMWHDAAAVAVSCGSGMWHDVAVTWWA